jgi:archaemetzincin
VGVTPKDVAIPIFTFVFGRARAGGSAALVSLARLDPAFYGLGQDNGLMAWRAVQEMLHELGHLALLGHCPDAACVMSFAGSVEKIDVRGAGFCARCAPGLPSWLAAHPGVEAVVGHVDCS